MKPPIRVVCEGCLRSVELALDFVLADGTACPFCGRRLDSGTGSSEADTHVPEGSGGADATDPPETIDWTAAWTRGTLGSLGRFHLRERLGDGGFGQVYLAYDPRLDRDVALKVLKQLDPDERVMERFFREARAVARLDHPNIVSVHDSGFDGGRCWVAYQLVSGRPLWWYRDRQRMDPTTAARIIRDLADAVSHAHGMGVVHRDIKPGNVMIDDRGRPRLIDFGLARRSDVDSDLTRDGVVVGTPAYMSPEQAIGLSRQADERSDVYSLGVIFHELLCGRRSQEPGDRPANGKPGPPPPPEPARNARSINRNVPRPLDAICAKAMSRRPADRFPSARALAEAIDTWVASRRAPAYRVAAGVLALIGSVAIAAAAVSFPRLTANDASPNVQTALGAAKMAPVDPTPPPAPAPAAAANAGKSHAAAARLTDGQLFASSRKSSSRKYHIVPCPSSKSIGDDNLVILATPEDAEKQGYHPCERCKPPLATATLTSRREQTGDGP